MADEFGLPPGTPVAAGGGDSAAAAVGLGVVEEGQAFLSLGTSGVLFAATDRFRPTPDRAAHAFCHALPDRWHQMAVILSAAASLEWVAVATGTDVPGALREAKAVPTFGGPELFVPHLTGERTPHNDPAATGAFVNLTAGTTRGHLIAAVLEGVAFALADGADVLREAGSDLRRIAAVGGGARSAHSLRLIATALDRPLDQVADTAIGPATGAARLARLAVTGGTVADVCTPPATIASIAPDPDSRERCSVKRRAFQALHPALQPARIPA